MKRTITCKGCAQQLKLGQAKHIVDEDNNYRYGIKIGVYHKDCCPLCSPKEKVNEIEEG